MGKRSKSSIVKGAEQALAFLEGQANGTRVTTVELAAGTARSTPAKSDAESGKVRPGVRVHGSEGMKKSDRSKFVEQTVRAHVFDRTVEDIKARNASTNRDELQNLVDNAVGEVRAERRSKCKAYKR